MTAEKFKAIVDGTYTHILVTVEQFVKKSVKDCLLQAHKKFGIAAFTIDEVLIA
jgi:hypothetical protein